MPTPGEDAPPHRRRGRRLVGRLVGWLPEVVVVAVVASALLAWHLDLGTKWGLAVPPPEPLPADVLPPPGLDLPRVRPAPAVATPLTGSRASKAKVETAVRTLLADRRLGRQVDVLVTDLTDDRVVYRHGRGTVAPASTMKLLTSVAALQSIGPRARFDTTVTRVRGTNRVVLVGGGDPFLTAKPPDAETYPARADVATLARRTAEALKRSGTTTVRLGYDDSLFTGPTLNPFWPRTYLPEGVVAPITSLTVDEGHRVDGPGFVDAPSAQAAKIFRDALGARGVTVQGEATRQTSPRGARTLARVSSPPLGQIVSRLLLVSDNHAAEVVAHHVGLRERTGGSFLGGAAGVRKVLGSLDVPLYGAVLHDGSGLSRKDRLDPRTLTTLLHVAASADHPRLREAVTGMPVAGFSGSLQDRFDLGAAAGRGRVQAKTGTLTGVHGLAGIATDLDGDVLGFVAIADRVPGPQQLYARTTIDKLAAALGACHCSAG